MKTTIIIGGMCVALLCFVSGCSIRHGDFTVASNKLFRLSDFELGKAERAKGIEGKDINHIIIFIPTGISTLEGALDDAFEKADGDLMTDVVIHSWWWWIPYIYGQTGWTVHGDMVKTRK